MATATLLLPPRIRFAGQRLPDAVARALGRADRLPIGDAGERAQLLRHFELLPRGWPVAALTRDLDVGDAASCAWLRADPAWVRPDINGARLMACGDMLRLTTQDSNALLPALRALFGDAGCTLDAPTPARWYLRLPRETRLPAFADPAEALGADLFEHLPGADDASSEARFWRTLASETQVLLHNHPWNAQRAAAGKPPVNALWFWGAGVLPDRVTARHSHVYSNDPLVNALASTASVPHAQLHAIDLSAKSGLYDLRDVAVMQSINEWIAPVIGAIGRGVLTSAMFDFADGAGFAIARRQRGRLWRKPLPTLD